jgi:DNA-binding transcriptional MerR regulator
MAELFTVGEFAKLTHLSVKTLHHYHEAGLLEPASVDPVTGYRRYSADQLAAAQLARRLRDVRMPLAQVRDVLSAPDPAAREAGIAAHLDRLRQDLAGTAAAVASLQALLVAGPPTASAVLRDAAATACVLLSDDVGRDAIGPWCAQAYPRLFGAAGKLGVPPSGAGGALYSGGWFEDGGGTVTAYLPLDLDPGAVATAAAVPGRVTVGVLPAQRLAVLEHRGPFDDLDLTYARLGRHVLRHGTGTDGPLREVYLISPADTDDPTALLTEVCWPVKENA